MYQSYEDDVKRRFGTERRLGSQLVYRAHTNPDRAAARLQHRGHKAQSLRRSRDGGSIFHADSQAEAVASGGSLVVIDRAGGEVIGSLRYYEWDESQLAVAVGFTFLIDRTDRQGKF